MKKTNILSALVIMMLFTNACSTQKTVSCCEGKKAANELVLTNAFDSISYAWGVNIGNFLIDYSYDTLDYTIMAAAMADKMSGEDIKIQYEVARELIANYGVIVANKEAARNKTEGEAFLAEVAKQDGIIALESGLLYKIDKLGDGDLPKNADRVVVHYHGTFIDGTVFDSSVAREEPFEFVLGIGQVIKGWEEGLKLLPTGTKATLYIPSDLAYGDNPRPGGVVKPGMALIFELEVLSLKPAE